MLYCRHMDIKLVKTDEVDEAAGILGFEDRAERHNFAESLATHLNDLAKRFEADASVAVVAPEGEPVLLVRLGFASCPNRALATERIKPERVPTIVKNRDRFRRIVEVLNEEDPESVRPGGRYMVPADVPECPPFALDITMGDHLARLTTGSLYTQAEELLTNLGRTVMRNPDLLPKAFELLHES